MEQYRGILALLSCISGAVLLIAATRAALSAAPTEFRRRRALATAIYGSLFIAAGILLWIRKEPAVADSPQVAPRRVVESNPVPQPVSAEVIDSSARAISDDQDGAPRKETVPTLAAIEPGIRTSVKAEPSAGSSGTKSANSADDPLYLAIDHAFSAIEAFFDRYGSPAPEPTRIPLRLRPARQSETSINFPSVEFVDGSTTLLPESLLALKNLAAELISHPGIRVEIQSRVDDFGSEVNDFMLSQARACAIRDLLIVEGVSSERLTAKGFGSQPLLSSTVTPIAFVVR